MNNSNYTTHYKLTFTNASQLLTFSNQNLHHCSLFELNANLCHLEINCGAATCTAKHL